MKRRIVQAVAIAAILVPFLAFAALAFGQTTRPSPRVFVDYATALYSGDPAIGQVSRLLAYGNNAERSPAYGCRFVYDADGAVPLDDGVPVVINDERAKFNFSKDATPEDEEKTCGFMRERLRYFKAKAPSTPVTWLYVLPNGHQDFGAAGEASLKSVTDLCDFIVVDTSTPEQTPAKFDGQLASFSDLIAKAAPDLPQVMMMVPYGDDKEYARRLAACAAHPRCAGLIVWTDGRALAGPNMPPDVMGRTFAQARAATAPGLSVRGATKAATTLADLDDAALLARGRDVVAEINARQAASTDRATKLGAGKGELAKQLGGK